MSGTGEKSVPLLLMKDIVKNFPGVRALDGVSFSLNRSEVHVLLGENGAGKSTLIKILAGAYRFDNGEILINGRKVEVVSPRLAEELGIAVIYQEFNLVPYLSVAENVFLGRLPVKKNGLGIVDWKRLQEKAGSFLSVLNCDINPRAVVNDLSLAEKQMVEIAKALSKNAKIMVMDEPTAALSSPEIEGLFRIIDQFRKNGGGVIYISHRLEEIFEIGDRVTVLRDGKYVGTLPVKGATQDVLIKMMVGRKIDTRFPWKERERGDKVLSVKGLTLGGAFYDIDFELYRGEILGLAGLLGSGRSRLIRALFGAESLDGGSIEMNPYGKICLETPRDAIAHGIGYLPSDRKGLGLILCLTVVQNVTIASLFRFAINGLIRLKDERKITDKLRKQLEIKTPSLKQEVTYLSGGNQQKVLLAKWLCSQSKVVLFEEPTRGIDVGAKQEIYRLIMEMSKEGRSVIMASSELPELLGISDRILVMRDGRIRATLLREEATQEIVLQHLISEKPGNHISEPEDC